MHHNKEYVWTISFLCVCVQLYTVSRDGALCMWESDTEPEDLKKGLRYKERKQKERQNTRGLEDEEEEEEEVGEVGEDGERRGEVVKGSADAPKEEEGIKNVRYKQRSK